MGQLKLDSTRRKRVKYCPCNKSNKDGKFVPYIDHDRFGYCHSCGENFLPSKGTILEPLPPPLKLPTFYHEHKLVCGSGRNFNRNNFISYLLTRFDKKEVQRVITKYLIGTSNSWKGATVFWQIDNEQKVRHGKIMLYDAFSGRRSKKHFNTVRSVLNLNDEGYKLRQCLFGLHLINESKNRTIAIVESEKTAIVMSLLFHEFTWIATGGKGNLKYDLMKPLKAYRIVAFPDKDAIIEWKESAQKLNKYGFKIQVDELLLGLDVPKNTDLADIFLKDSAKERQKSIVPLLSLQDISVNRLKSINPSIQYLINEFDLVHENGKEIEPSPC